MTPDKPIVRLSHSDCARMFENTNRKIQLSWRIQAVEAIMPFWIRAISVCSDQTGWDKDKTAELQSFAISVPDRCREWRDGNKVVRARVNELWKPTSAVWNATLQKSVRDLTVAPVIRNMHSVITGLLNAASDERNDPWLFGLVFSMAFTRTRFRFDSSDLMCFSKVTDLEGVPFGDRVPLIYAQAARELYEVEAMQTVFDDTLVVAKSLGELPYFDADSFDWSAKDRPDWYQLRSGAIRAFHGR